MDGISKHALVILAVAAAAAGCATSTLSNISVAYYFWGPAETIEVIDASDVAPADRVLVELERGMALLELGRYEESRAVLTRAGAALDAASAGGIPTVGADGATLWTPESFERVLVHTLRIADSLALQDAGGAEAAADDALRVAAEVDCGRCRFAFTRCLAALAYEAVGRYDDGLDALGATTAHDRADDPVAELTDRLVRGIGGVEPTGFAPPPEAGPRTLVAILLLGRGPYKVDAKLAVGESGTIGWSRYLPRDPQAVTWAALEVEDPVISVELTDVEDLAVASLRDRAERVVAARGAGAGPNADDPRHWSSLPASLQILNLELPPDLDAGDLVYYSPEGYEVDRETIRWPDDWTGGRLFVIRRMP